MLQLPGDLRLLDEPPNHVGLVAELFPEDLDRQVTAQVIIVPLEHDPHAAVSKLAEELDPLRPSTRSDPVPG